MNAHSQSRSPDGVQTTRSKREKSPIDALRTMLGGIPNWMRCVFLRLGIGGVARTIKKGVRQHGLKVQVGWSRVVRASSDDRPRRCRSSRAGVSLWDGDWREPIDTVSGYVARGQPGPGDVVFDLGAYVGEATVAMARLVGPTGKVIAFEPNPENRKLLERNVTEQGIS